MALEYRLRLAVVAAAAAGRNGLEWVETGWKRYEHSAHAVFAKAVAVRYKPMTRKGLAIAHFRNYY